MAGTDAVTAWPFAVGAGRRLDFRTVCAPDFLVASGEYGVLADRVAPVDPDGPPELLRLTSHRGRPLSVGVATRVVTSADLNDVSSPNGASDRDGGSGGDVVRDDHGRPLELVYGFVMDGDPPDAVDPADLRAALDCVAPAYARFLRDEERFSVVATRSFAAHSRPETTTETPAAPPASSRETGLVAAEPPPFERAVPGRGWYALAGLAVAAALAAAVAVLFLVRVLGGGSSDVLEEYDKTLTASTMLSLDDGTVADRPTAGRGQPHCPEAARPDLQMVDGDGIYACPGSQPNRVAVVADDASCRSGGREVAWRRQIEAVEVEEGRTLCVRTANGHLALVTVAEVQREAGSITSIELHVVVRRD